MELLCLHKRYLLLPGKTFVNSVLFLAAEISAVLRLGWGRVGRGPGIARLTK